MPHIRLSITHTPSASHVFFAMAMLVLVSASSLVHAQQRSRSFTFNYIATVKDIPAGAKKLELWLPIPHNDPYQHVTRLEIKAPYPYEIRRGQYGNSILYISVEDPPPTSPVTVAIDFDAVRKEHIQATLGMANNPNAPMEPSDPDMARWLAPDRLVP